MLSVVFQRMEAFDRRAKLETEAALAALGKENDDDSRYEQRYCCRL